MPVRKTQLATLAYAPETDFNNAPESSAATLVEVLSESFSPVTQNEGFGYGIDGSVRSGSLSKISLSPAFAHYLRSMNGVDLIKAALRGRVTTSGSAPYQHLIQTAARDYSFTFQRATVECGTQLYHGCRVAGLTVEIPMTGNVRASVSLIGARESRPASALFTALEAEDRLPFFAMDAFFRLNGETIDGLISAAVEIKGEAEIGRFDPVSQRADEAWIGTIESRIRATLYASDVDDLGIEESEATHLVEAGVDDGEHSVLFRSLEARVVNVSRPYVAIGGYQQTIEFLGLPIEALMVNDQSSI